MEEKKSAEIISCITFLRSLAASAKLLCKQ